MLWARPPEVRTRCSRPRVLGSSLPERCPKPPVPGPARSSVSTCHASDRGAPDSAMSRCKRAASSSLNTHGIASPDAGRGLRERTPRTSKTQRALGTARDHALSPSSRLRHNLSCRLTLALRPNPSRRLPRAFRHKPHAPPPTHSPPQPLAPPPTRSLPLPLAPSPAHSPSTRMPLTTSGLQGRRGLRRRHGLYGHQGV